MAVQSSLLITRLVRFAPLEVVFAVLAAVVGTYGMIGLREFDASPTAATVTPLVYAFGMWPFVIAWTVAAVAAAIAVAKARS